LIVYDALLAALDLVHGDHLVVGGADWNCEVEIMPGEIKLKEGANFGDWIEANLHMQFTCMADQKFANGQLTRDERLALSSASGDGLDAFRASLTKVAPALYERTHWEDAPEPPEEDGMMMDEAADITESGSQAMVIDVVEKAVRADGTMPVKVIQKGWGSSGYYSPDVLKRDGSKVFAKGLQMFWDHQTEAQEVEKPEGSLNDLAAVFISDARWDENGVKGPGLYAETPVIEP